ncbi:MAG TPA: class I SAM-dependent methyltransferase [Roseiflexaceae bacterium]|nr:class I SAM-dependent methyltransferase [Roseiflexaceae bacterium]
MSNYDPTIYQGTAAYYTRGRPPYTRTLAAVLTAELGLDGAGRLLDVGCGPGILTVELAGLFEQAIGLDPDAEMLAEGARRAAEVGSANIHWIQARGEDIPTLELGSFRLATFGQSFHWMDREQVAEAVYDILEPGGALALLDHEPEGGPRPAGPGYPLIPHEAIRALIERYLGPRRRAGQGFASWSEERHEHFIARSRFGALRRVYAPGRPDIVRNVDEVLANYFSMSYAAPHLFGDKRAEFAAAVRAALARQSPSGRFWDWPGDTEILLAVKPG